MLLNILTRVIDIHFTNCQVQFKTEVIINIYC